MKMMRFAVVALSVALAACGSQGKTDSESSSPVTQAADHDAKLTASDCDAKLTADARSDCHYHRMLSARAPQHSTRAPVVDPLLGKPLDQAASSSTAPSNAGSSH